MRSYLYYIGHSTTLLQLESRAFLTDPLLRSRASFLRRKASFPLLPDFKEIAPTILLSHAHRDHLHLASLRMLDHDLPIYAPPKTAMRLRKKGFIYADPVSPGDEIDLADGTSLHVLPAAHGGEEAVGYMISGDSKRVYFAGDTDLFPEMENGFGEIDLALLPISGWGNRLGPGHMNPERAAQAASYLRPKNIIPIHWGSFAPIGMPSRWAVDRDADGEFFRALYKHDMDQRLHILRPGQFFFFKQDII